jgi:hypothetical protein
MFRFNQCLPPEATQADAFDAVEMPALCSAVLGGESCTVFCYGQTGSGKTFTMSGPAAVTVALNPEAIEAAAGVADFAAAPGAENGASSLSHGSVQASVAANAAPARLSRVEQILAAGALASDGVASDTTTAWATNDDDGALSLRTAADIAEATHHLGLQYRAARHLFDAIAALPNGAPEPQTNDAAAAAGEAASGPSPVTRFETHRAVVRAAMYEVYNEQVNDLLGETTNHKLRWSAQSACFFVENLMVVECHDVDDLLAVLYQGAAQRKRASHNLNVDSSRSHVVMVVGVEHATTTVTRRVRPTIRTDRVGANSSTGTVTFVDVVTGMTTTETNITTTALGRLTFVDLAGSESLRESGSTGRNAVETRNINKSLFTLGKVILALQQQQQRSERGGGGVGSPAGANNNKAGGGAAPPPGSGAGGIGGHGSSYVAPPTPTGTVTHIPYRDSTLTKLLMDAIGGVCRTVLVACLTPSSRYADETARTLAFAARAQSIENQLPKNVFRGGVTAAGGAAIARDRAAAERNPFEVIAALEAQLVQVQTELALVKAENAELKRGRHPPPLSQLVCPPHPQTPPSLRASVTSGNGDELPPLMAGRGPVPASPLPAASGSFTSVRSDGAVAAAGGRGTPLLPSSSKPKSLPSVVDRGDRRQQHAAGAAKGTPVKADGKESRLGGAAASSRSPSVASTNAATRGGAMSPSPPPPAAGLPRGQQSPVPDGASPGPKLSRRIVGGALPPTGAAGRKGAAPSSPTPSDPVVQRHDGHQGPPGFPAESGATPAGGATPPLRSFLNEELRRAGSAETPTTNAGLDISSAQRRGTDGDPNGNTAISVSARGRRDIQSSPARIGAGSEDALLFQHHPRSVAAASGQPAPTNGSSEAGLEERLPFPVVPVAVSSLTPPPVAADSAAALSTITTGTNALSASGRSDDIASLLARVVLDNQTLRNEVQALRGLVLLHSGGGIPRASSADDGSSTAPLVLVPARLSGGEASPLESPEARQSDEKFYSMLPTSPPHVDAVGALSSVIEIRAPARPPDQPTAVSAGAFMPTTRRQPVIFGGTDTVAPAPHAGTPPEADPTVAAYYGTPPRHATTERDMAEAVARLERFRHGGDGAGRA